MSDAPLRLYLVDGSGFIFRAFHALPPLTRKSDGLPIGAVSGFCNMLFKLLQDTKAGERPTHLAVIFDTSRTSFRNEIYPEYKAHRPPPPEDLVPQFSLIRDATRAFGVPAVLGLLPGRVTYVIDPDGVVRRRFSSQFSPKKHIDEALSVISGASA